MLPCLLNQFQYNVTLFDRTQTVECARAEAERVRLIGAAEARAIEAVGRAEAEKMRMKASAYKQYGDAAVMALVLEALPQVSLDFRRWQCKPTWAMQFPGTDMDSRKIGRIAERPKE